MSHLPAAFQVAEIGHIRLLLPSDLRELEWHGGPDLRSFYEEMWRLHERGEATVLVAEFNRYPVGQLVIHWSGKPGHLGFPDQQSLRVHPAFRGMGLGTALIEASEYTVRQAGHAKIGLSVNVLNDKARKLYERLGYTVIGEAYEDKWSYVDAAGAEIVCTETVLDMVKPLVTAKELSWAGEKIKAAARS